MQCVLVEGTSRKSEDDLAGRAESNKRIVFPRCEVDGNGEQGQLRCLEIIQMASLRSMAHQNIAFVSNHTAREPAPGDYLAVRVTGSSAGSLFGEAMHLTTLADFEQKYPRQR